MSESASSWDGRWKARIPTDATTKVREDGWVQNIALVTTLEVNEDGKREILGISISSSETESAWQECLRRGLSGVQLVISDAHRG